MSEISSDVLIIGAGPAGTCAAAMLKRAGLDCVVVEKQRFPRFIIGESLLPRCMDHLDAAGLLPAVQKQKYMYKPGALLLHGVRQTHFDFSDGFTKGWTHAYQVPRADFDKTLADAVSSMGVPIHYEHAVTGASLDGDTPELRICAPDGREIVAKTKFVLDASGFGRVLPRLLDLDRASDFPSRDALFTHYLGDVRPSGDAAGDIWVISHHEANGVWFWVIPFSDGRTSLGVVAQSEFFSHYRGSPDEMLRTIVDSDPNAKQRCGEKDYCFEPRRISGYAIGVASLFGASYALLGNAAEFLDPVFSSGVTIALESANTAARLLIRQFSGEAVDWQKEYSDYLMRGVDTFRTFVKGWYSGVLPTIFYQRDRNQEIRRKLCSILAGYVWDENNPYAREPERSLGVLYEWCKREESEAQRIVG